MEIKERGYGRMTIGGEERGFRVGTYQSKVFCDVRGIKASQFFEELEKFSFDNNLENNIWLCDYLYAALVADCKFRKIEPDFVPDDLQFWVDAEGATEEVAKLFVVMAEMKRTTPKKSDA